jgi:adenine/guanine phosphoribosyltransferase-like PRPP-binding protein
MLIREADKLPPPTISVIKPRSHISTCAFNDLKEKRIKIERYAVCKGTSVVVVNDVLSIGRIIYAVLQLLRKASIRIRDISVIVVAEFPVHRGRELLRACGFSGIHIQSLLVLGGI